MFLRKFIWAVIQESIFMWPCISNSNDFLTSKKSYQKYVTFNDTYRENLCLYSIQYKNGCVAASDFFHMFTQSIKFYTFYNHIIKSTGI